ncbi:hypothetical protein O181_116178 [Austropuccinia psidii MF-1]|uniref:Integrase zinc-binding domain-containing protein n=1 Tax=Austropuccinia psidii MF-1 TaxID=1389203 RepID=A0A9Q3K7V1_9BASI|nr:hypothetical protein [Austropuccinia psidii MF-1]
MNIVHKDGNIHKNSDGFSKWELTNTPDHPAYVPTSAEPQIPIEGINITDVGTEFFEEVRESYKQDKNCQILTALLDKYCKDAALDNSLDDIWKTSYDNGIFHLFDDKTMERIKTYAWWPSWRKDVIQYCYSCDRCQKENKDTGKRFGLMIHIQQPSTPWEVVHMDWVTSLPPGGDKSYNALLFILDRDRQTPIFSPCHNNDTAVDTDLLIWNRVIFHTCLFKNIIGDRDPKFTSALWTNLHNCLGTKLSFSTE